MPEPQAYDDLQCEACGHSRSWSQPECPWCAPDEPYDTNEATEGRCVHGVGFDVVCVACCPDGFSEDDT